jgi:hypothetical protein
MEWEVMEGLILVMWVLPDQPILVLAVEVLEPREETGRMEL